MTTHPDPVVVEQRGGTLLLTLNRPEVHNAVNARMATMIGAELEHAQHSDDIRVVVIHGGAPGSFCSGADLKCVAAGELPNSVEHPEWGFLGLVKHQIDKPIIASAAGSAYAGGVEMLLGCDLVVAAAGARFLMTEVEFGLFPSMGRTVRLAGHVGTKTAFEWMMLGRPITAETALARGLVNTVVAAPDVLPTALSWADRIARQPAHAVQAGKRAFYAAVNGARVTEQLHWRVSDREWVQLRATPAGQAGPRSFDRGPRRD